MLVQFRRCNSDLDYASFTLCFLQNRHAFSQSFSLADSIIHLLGFLSNSQVILIEEGHSKVIGWGHYQFMNTEREIAPDGETAFIHSVFVSPDYRSSRVFLRGFRYLAEQVQTATHGVRYVEFCARCEDDYLNRLYSKFAQVVGEQEGHFGQENIYRVELSRLVTYLGMTKQPIDGKET
ncbi:hypothetical protein AV540_03705 [Brevibacillus parabrevis]|uniref:GNAT family N-acetyltransferase n=1 Tax=Brevibacillus parabrevis TaxID=54914 RepID=UPI0007AB550F|nr:GNAT family N-acetyltransferase [Brevibacillus parabrevis]KZE39297.1 hypothetical protein AV540_03705 [Brevibacillus parabrevis]